MKRLILVEIETSVDGERCSENCPMYQDEDYASWCRVFGPLRVARRSERGCEHLRHPRCLEQPITLHFTGQERLAPDTVYVTANFRKVDP